jgi:dTDP-4-amino-4,6-dideoxygalactose transaminase
MRTVKYVNLSEQFAEARDDIYVAVENTFGPGQFIGGNAVEMLEQDLATFVGVRHVVAVNSGTDALILGLKALNIGPGDEVITPPNSFVASTSAIVAVGAKPIFADVRQDQNVDPRAVGAAVTPRTRAIMPVHLTGRMADMSPIMEIAERHGLAVIEDAAQAIGSRYQGRNSGTFGTCAAFSAHPLKNLNAAGDAGFLATNDIQIVQKVRLLRNHGLVNRDTVEIWGTVSRMDALQAEILRRRLPRLAHLIERRRQNAENYKRLLAQGPVSFTPCRDYEFNTFHTFVIQTDHRNELQAYLRGRGIGTRIHYPVPIHLQPAAASLGYRRGDFPVAESQADRILSLPIHQFLSFDDQSYVADEIGMFFQKSRKSDFARGMATPTIAG